MPTANIAVVILAAGASSRFGSPKQLLPYNGKPLVRHIAEIVLHSKARSASIVLGAEQANIQAALAGLSLSLVTNSDWREGIGSSVRAGIASLPETVDAAIFVLCDQPLVTSDLIDAIIDSHATTGKPIVATEYSRTRGVPALFARKLFSELLLLRGDRGAKSVIAHHANEVASIPFPGGSVDIDTPEDLS
ncbi:MAG TPA: nucleotidyltransferase family protein [Bacteroidota bacterium]